jgi:DNA-binding CsgD family transcriptional regulator/GAF domain-containing protein
LVDLIGAAYAFDDLDAFREGIPAALRASVPADVGSYNEFDDDPSRVWWTSDPHLPISDELGARFAELSPENPVLAHIARTQDGRPRRISDFLDRDAFHATRLYREFYRHVGVEQLVGMALPSPSPVVIGLGLTRDGDVAFSDEEVALLAAARPHLMRAYRQAELASTRSATIAALEAGLEALGTPVLVTDARGRVTMATPQARRLLVRRLGAGGSTTRLADDVRTALTRRHAADTPATEPLRLPDGERTLTLRVLRGPDLGTDLIVVEPGNAGLSVVALEGIGLTRREAEAVRWLALGRRGTDIADVMGISPRTVEKHLENAYAKLGVSTASDAAATAWAAVGVRLPRVAGPPAPRVDGLPPVGT